MLKKSKLEILEGRILWKFNALNTTKLVEKNN